MPQIGIRFRKQAPCLTWAQSPTQTERSDTRATQLFVHKGETKGETRVYHMHSFEKIWGFRHESFRKTPRMNWNIPHWAESAHTNIRLSGTTLRILAGHFSPEHFFGVAPTGSLRRSCLSRVQHRIRFGRSQSENLRFRNQFWINSGEQLSRESSSIQGFLKNSFQLKRKFF